MFDAVSRNDINNSIFQAESIMGPGPKATTVSPLFLVLRLVFKGIVSDHYVVIVILAAVVFHVLLLVGLPSSCPPSLSPTLAFATASLYLYLSLVLSWRRIGLNLVHLGC